MTSILFTPRSIGPIEVKNRFVHSATYEAMAAPTGEVTEGIVRRYRKVSRGEVGLIIPGFMYVHPDGRPSTRHIGIHEDAMVPGLTRLAEAARRGGSRVFFQIAHAGSQSSREVLGRTPLGPSGSRRDPIYLFRPARMTEEDIHAAIGSFGEAARRAAEAGADGVQIHAAHGYLLSQFLSPFLNDRDDAWGGSEEGRFRFLREVYLAVRKALPRDRAVIVKINADDHIPGKGVTPHLAARYCGRLAGLGVDGVEVSCALGFYSFMNLIRGDVPVEELVRGYPLWKRVIGRVLMGRLAGKYDLVEGYNLGGATIIRAALGGVPLIVVGGFRSMGRMEQAVAVEGVDFVSLSRPFVREPGLVKRFREGKAAAATCASCNQCFAAVRNGLPLTCYNKTLPPAETLP